MVLLYSHSRLSEIHHDITEPERDCLRLNLIICMFVQICICNPTVILKQNKKSGMGRVQLDRRIAYRQIKDVCHLIRLKGTVQKI